MRAVITVIGKDKVGILAKVSEKCAEYNANITDVTQSILQDMFVMIMFVDITNLKIQLKDLSAILEKAGNELNLKIHVMHEDIFNAMHRI